MESLNKEKLKIAVVGTGAVGSVIASCLSTAGHDVSVSDVKPEFLEAIRKDGIQVHGQLDLSVTPAGVYEGFNIFDHGPFDLVVLVLKVPILARLAKEIAQHDKPGTVYVAACNGLGSEEPLVEALGAERVHRMVLNLAAGVDSPGKVHLVSFMGDAVIGPCAHTTHSHTTPGTITARLSRATSRPRATAPT